MISRPHELTNRAEIIENIVVGMIIPVSNLAPNSRHFLALSWVDGPRARTCCAVHNQRQNDHDQRHEEDNIVIKPLNHSVGHCGAR